MTRSFSSFLILSLCCSTLGSCIFKRETVDASFPTVAEMDALDVSWGLPKRKTKGGPRRVFQYYEPKAGAASPAVPEMISPEPPASPVPLKSQPTRPASSNGPTPNPPVPSALR